MKKKVTYDRGNESLRFKNDKLKHREGTTNRWGIGWCHYIQLNIVTQLGMDCLQDPADSQKIIRDPVTGVK